MGQFNSLEPFFLARTRARRIYIIVKTINLLTVGIHAPLFPKLSLFIYVQNLPLNPLKTPERNTFGDFLLGNF